MVAVLLKTKRLRLVVARKASGMDLRTKNVWAEQDPFQVFEIPPQLEESLKRHRENLEKLICSLQMVGISEAQIEESVSVIVASYKEELVQTIKALKR